MEDMDGLLDEDEDDDFLRMVDTLEQRNHSTDIGQGAAAVPTIPVTADVTGQTVEAPNPLSSGNLRNGKSVDDSIQRRVPTGSTDACVTRTATSAPSPAARATAAGAGAAGWESLRGGRGECVLGDNDSGEGHSSKRARRSPPRHNPSRTPTAAARTPVQRAGPTTPALHNLQLSGQRRFPGPAGLLPRLMSAEQLAGGKKGGQAVAKTWEMLEGAKRQPADAPMTEEMFDAEKFDSGAWISMATNMRGFTQYKGGRGVDINTKNSIMTVLHGGAKGKVPMLCVMVKQLTLSDTDASMLLVDPSGEMKGTLHRRVFDKYSAEDLSIGAVLVLKQVSVFSPAPRRFYLNITPNNILKLFRTDTPMPDKSPSPRTQDSMSGGNWTSTTPHLLESRTVKTLSTSSHALVSTPAPVHTSPAVAPKEVPRMGALSDATNKHDSASTLVIPKVSHATVVAIVDTACSGSGDEDTTKTNDMDAASVEALLEGLDDDLFDD